MDIIFIENIQFWAFNFNYLFSPLFINALNGSHANTHSSRNRSLQRFDRFT
jgi:hypothetical protein